jgi:hypothetical protein
MPRPLAPHRIIHWPWKITAIAVVYFIGFMISAAVVMAIGMKFPEIPGFSYNPLLSFAGALVLGIAVAVLARGISGSWIFRWAVLFVFTYVSYCVNNQIEAAIFTTLGGFNTMLILFLLPCALVAGAAVLLVKAPTDQAVLVTVFSARTGSAWLGRSVLAWLSFPVIYYLFGMLIYPLVAEAYEQQEFGLVIPSMAVVASVVSLRSLLFLIVTIPILVNWSRSRRSLLWSLGVSFTAMVGLVGLIESTWMPATMRIVHALEIAADSLVYAWVLRALMVPRQAHHR